MHTPVVKGRLSFLRRGELGFQILTPLTQRRIALMRDLFFELNQFAILLLQLRRKMEALSQILQVNSMLTMGREVAAPDIAERADDFEYHCRKAEAPVEG